MGRRAAPRQFVTLVLNKSFESIQDLKENEFLQKFCVKNETKKSFFC